MVRTAVIIAQVLCPKSEDLFFGVASGIYRFSHVRLLQTPQYGGIEPTTINVLAKPVLDASVVSSYWQLNSLVFSALVRKSAVRHYVEDRCVWIGQTLDGSGIDYKAAIQSDPAPNEIRWKALANFRRAQLKKSPKQIKIRKIFVYSFL